MKKKRFSVEQIVAVLKQAEVGVPVAEVIRKVGISEQTFYRWKKQYVGMETEQARQLKQLQDENSRLKQLVADLGMDTIQNLALASDTFRIFVPDPRIPKNFGDIMQQNARRVAIIVGTLPLDKTVRDITVMAALLHEVGKLVLASKMPNEFCALLSLMRERGCPQNEAEKELLGISHSELGAYLLGLWGINSIAIEAIAHLHDPIRIPHIGFDSSAALYVASLLARELDAHPDDLQGKELSEPDLICLDTLGVLRQFPLLRERAIESLKEHATSIG